MGNKSHIIKSRAIEMHVLTAKQWNTFVEIASRSAFGRHAASNLCGNIFDSFNRPFRIGKCGVECFFTKFVEGFELAAFGGEGGVNRRATRIQIRRDALLFLAS